MINSVTRSSLSNKQWYRSMLAGNPPVPDFELISTTLLSSSQASVTFDVTGLGSTYKHLQIRAVAKQDATGFSYGGIRFNADTGTNYSYHGLEADGTSVVSNSGTSTTYMSYLLVRNNNAAVYSALVADFLDVFNATTYKTIRTLSGAEGSTAGKYVGLRSGNWRSTSAVTSITLIPTNTNFQSGSRFSLYGIKG